MAFEYSESRFPSRTEIKFPAIIENSTKLGGHKRFIHNLNFWPITSVKAGCWYIVLTTQFYVFVYVISTAAATNTTIASHKSNPSAVPHSYVHSYTTLSWVTWEAVTGVEGIPCWGLLRHTLANGDLVYPSQGGRYRAEGCIYHVGLGSAWGSVFGDLMLSPLS